MDRASLLKHLAQAERHVVEGQRSIARQEGLIGRLDRDGHDTTEALKVLANLRTTQALHEADLGRILGELGGEPP